MVNRSRCCRNTARHVLLVAAVGLIAACGGGEEAANDLSSVTSDPPLLVGGDLDAAITVEAALPAVPASSARLSLANGEVLEFAIDCMLEETVDQSFQVLYTVESAGVPRIAIVQQGDEGRGSAMAKITVRGESTRPIWEAASLYVNSGASAALLRDGTTITGTGGFFPGADFDAVPVVGTLTANCSTG